MANRCVSLSITGRSANLSLITPAKNVLSLPGISECLVPQHKERGTLNNCKPEIMCHLWWWKQPAQWVSFSASLSASASRSHASLKKKQWFLSLNVRFVPVPNCRVAITYCGFSLSFMCFSSLPSSVPDEDIILSTRSLLSTGTPHCFLGGDKFGWKHWKVVGHLHLSTYILVCLLRMRNSNPYVTQPLQTPIHTK